MLCSATKAKVVEKALAPLRTGQGGGLSNLQGGGGGGATPLEATNS